MVFALKFAGSGMKGLLRRNPSSANASYFNFNNTQQVLSIGTAILFDVAAVAIVVGAVSYMAASALPKNRR